MIWHIMCKKTNDIIGSFQPKHYLIYKRRLLLMPLLENLMTSNLLCKQIHLKMQLENVISLRDS